jgi:1-deoxy-D-xylulose-5-phosphate synthase
VVFAVDRAGLVGEDGETHHGLFDIAFLNTVPGMTVLCPANYAELRVMLDYSVHGVNGPVAVRYPRGGEGSYREHAGTVGASVLREGADITLVGYGTMTGTILNAAEKLASDGFSVEVVKFNSVNPIDWDCVLRSVAKTGRLLIAEDCVSMGSVGERIAARLLQEGVEVRGIALCSCGSAYMPHGSIQQLKNLAGLDEESLYRKALEVLHGER